MWCLKFFQKVAGQSRGLILGFKYLWNEVGHCPVLRGSDRDGRGTGQEPVRRDYTGFRDGVIDDRSGV